MIGNITERQRRSAPPVAPSIPRSAGFPKAVHRSKKLATSPAALESQRAADTSWVATSSAALKQPQLRPPLTLDIPSNPEESRQDDLDRMHAEISAENTNIVNRMTPEQRETERQEILQRFGGDIGDILRKAREAREKAARRSPSKGSLRRSSVSSASDMDMSPASRSGTPHPDSLNTTSSGLKRTLRFADVKPSDVYIYESQPSSPKKERLALPPPPDQKDDSIISLSPSNGSHHPPELSSNPNFQSPSSEVTLSPLSVHTTTEGTPEDIRRRFFPEARSDEPALSWIAEKPAPNASATSASETRYDLEGHPIPRHLHLTLPTHLGLHHHGAADQAAGYTLDDVLHLVRSTVPAQRMAMMRVLGGILRHLHEERNGGGKEGDPSSQLAEIDSTRKNIVAAGIEALTERSPTILVRVVDVIWEGIGAWEKQWDSWGHELPLVEFELRNIDPRNSLGTPRSSSSEAAIEPPLIISGLPLPSILPHFAELLDSQTLPLTTLSKILSIIETISRQSKECVEAVVHTSSLLRALLAIFLGSLSSPSDSSKSPSQNGLTYGESPPIAVTTLRVFRLLLATKHAAVKLIETGIPDALLRSFIASPLDLVLLADYYCQELLYETLKFFANIGKYGLYCSAVTTAHAAFQGVGRRILDELKSSSGSDSNFISPSHSAPTLRNPSEPNRVFPISLLTSAWLDLLAVYLACALDPHVTTPVHDIKWSFVGKDGWRWGDDLLQFNEVMTGVEDALPFAVWASLWNTLASYLEGAFVNSTSQGWAAERELFRGAIQGGRVVTGALEECKAVLSSFTTTTKEKFSQETAADLRRLSSAAACLHASLRLELVLLREPTHSNETPATELEAIGQHHVSGEDVSEIPLDLIGAFCDAVVTIDSPWQLITKEGVPSFAYTFLLPLTSLLSLDLRLRHDMKRRHDTDWTKRWLAHAIRVLHHLLPSDELHGEWIISAVTRLMGAELSESLHWRVPRSVWTFGGTNLIAPFLKDALHPIGMQYGHIPIHLCQFSTTSDSVRLATQLLLPSSSAIRSQVCRDGPRGSRWGLPLAHDWCFSPLDHLLKPEKSRVLRSGLPMIGPDLSSISNIKSPANDEALEVTASETDLVRAALLFSGILMNLYAVEKLISGACVSHSETVFACMKIFMLEHDQRQGDSSDEVFRDKFVSKSMLSLLSHSKLVSRPSAKELHNLELVSRNFLGPSTPFFQFCTDFIMLYDALSFADPVFASLLIPPLSMEYPYDYRRLLWVDFSHILYTIRTDTSHPTIRDIGDYLWPVETNGDVMNAYVNILCESGQRALSDGILRFIALHHTACYIWPDMMTLGDASPPTWNEPKAQKLFMLLLSAPHETMRQMVFYRQEGRGQTLAPPACFGVGIMMGSTLWEQNRRDLALRWGGDKSSDRIRALFEPM
ncbi:uncharacterized protein EI90DRAFT_3121852 [Cantharellus anzutake]|uniref:uncharacterized protein n=1 Tax=Cantharellus anzutake TaxID=1750568 RepID=UPI0019045763|nr:uncharacterized protein EI90DRAFT_3121852 [Cantharellus anzutake]KAF8333505.1 hypothetical protein EI90DRAFT_3121852 [Cantharellus anzutake]